MLAVAPSIIFIAVSGVIRGYLSAEHKFLSVAISQIIEGGGKLAFGLAFAMLAMRLSMPLYAISAFTILGVSLGAIFGLVYLLIAARGVGDRVFYPYTREDKRAVMKKLYSISTPITLSAAVMSLTGLLDLFLIMKGLISSGASREVATALYGNYTTLAVPMFNLAVSLITPVSIAFLPSMTRAYINNRKDFSLVCGLTFGITAALTAPLAFGMMMYPREILSLLFEDSGAAIGSRPLLILSIGLFFYSALTVVNTALESMGLVRAPVYSMLVGCAVKLIVSLVLIRIPKYGIMGAPIGTVASYGVSLAVALIYGSKKCKEKFPIISSYTLPSLLAFVAVFLSKGAFFAVTSLVGEVAGTLAAIGVSGVLYLLLSMLFGVFKRDKILMMSKYTKLTGEI
jgi:stage V sporulation protein B